MEVQLGDVVQMRKAHPCGGNRWVVTRTGADVKIRCTVCGRIVMLCREQYEKGVKACLSRGNEAHE